MDTLTLSEPFPYLGRMIAYNNSNWVAVYLNLQKYQKRWTMLARVIERPVAAVRDWGEMYKTLAQSVLLYCNKSWFMTVYMLKILAAFHHWAAR